MFDVVGWVGMVLVLSAYLLLSTGRIKNGYKYQMMNFLAGVCMAIGLFPKKAWFSFVLQIAWAGIAVGAMMKLGRKKK